MIRYCLDANVFIQAKNGPYAFDIVPAYWQFLENKFVSGEIFSSLMIYDELAEGNDELAAWANKQRDKGCFVKPNESVQNNFQQIADYIVRRYPSPNARSFLGRADPWVIAHAKTENAIVVTHEVLVPDDSTKVKIPNVCKHFQIEYLDTYQMLRGLKARFG